MVGSIVVALVVAMGTRRLTAAAGVVFSAGSLAALLLSRTVGLFGFIESWNRPAQQTLATEMGAVVLLAIMLVTARPRPLALVSISDQPGRRPRP